MKCLFLAAGYATRLYPLTKDFPKPLLEVGGKPILDHLIADLESGTEKPEEYIVVTNHRFSDRFRTWANGHNETITVIDDGTETNETRLGAVRDIFFAVDACGIDEDLLVLAGDNLLSFSLKPFLRYAKEKQTSCIMRFFQPDPAKLRKTGVCSVDENDRILFMEEKPAEPKSNWCTPPFYYYVRQDVGLVRKGIEAGCGLDAPGSFVAWLASRVPVHAWEMPGRRYDIGDLASYEEVNRIWAERQA